ncbi:MAG: hypothetical protein Q7S01_03325 [bacterium]|nr:hypothetical protein [bacterium]
MNRRNIQIFSWMAAVAAVAAWAGVVMYASWISGQLDARQSLATDVESISAREMAAARLHALARETNALRLQLDNLANPDVISVANVIDSIGKISGSKLKIGGVIQEYAAQNASASDAPALHAVGFAVEAEGTFASLIHAAKLLETLPAPSSVQGLEFERAPLTTDSGSAKPAVWRLTAHIRVFTNADISS